MDTKALLCELELRPLKQLGQNFLVDPHVLERILDAAEVGLNDAVLEIGAGLGILTQALAARARRVVAVEVDHRLVDVLRERLGTCSNAEIIEGDILTLEITSLLQEAAYKAVANIPYYITSAVLRHLLEARVRPTLCVLMVQREVAQRIVAQPDEMSLLAVSVQFYGRPSVVARVPAHAFYPAPKVDSAIVRIDSHPTLALPEQVVSAFFDVVRAGFGQRRKQLHNALAHGLHLPAERVEQCLLRAGIAGERRAETLAVGEWVQLYRAFATR